jgi:2-iminobutanoate/2-iminopropanoate deaminase
MRSLNSKRFIAHFLSGAAAAVALAGCANTPKKAGLPWWPQGPGVAPEDVVRSSGDTPSRPAVQTGSPMALAPATKLDDHRSPAVRYGDLLFVSGQIANDPLSREIVRGGIEEQLQAAMDNVVKVLEGDGLAISNILSVTLYIQDIDLLPRADAVYATYFRRNLPARTVVRVDGLPEGSLVEIAVVAGK